MEIRSSWLCRRPLRALLLGVVTVFTLNACKEDCSKAARMGDFEFSQGNYVNAVKHYERALQVDNKCGVVEKKLADAKLKAAASH